MKVTAVIPAYNEEKTIAEIVEGAQKHVDETIVIDVEAQTRLPPRRRGLEPW